LMRQDAAFALKLRNASRELRQFAAGAAE